MYIPGPWGLHSEHLKSPRCPVARCDQWQTQCQQRLGCGQSGGLFQRRFQPYRIAISLVPRAAGGSGALVVLICWIAQIVCFVAQRSIAAQSPVIATKPGQTGAAIAQEHESTCSHPFGAHQTLVAALAGLGRLAPIDARSPLPLAPSCSSVGCTVRAALHIRICMLRALRAFVCCMLRAARYALPAGDLSPTSLRLTQLRSVVDLGPEARVPPPLQHAARCHPAS